MERRVKSVGAFWALFSLVEVVSHVFFKNKKEGYLAYFPHGSNFYKSFFLFSLLTAHFFYLVAGCMCFFP